MRTRLMRGKFSLLFLTIAVLLAVPAVAWAADTLTPDGDGLAPVASNNLNAGSVPCNSPTTKPVALALIHQGGANNTFANGSTVTVSVQSVTGPGLSASMGSPNTITLPSNWESGSNGAQSAIVNSTVTINPSVSGPGGGTVNYTATGTEATAGGGGPLTRTGTLNVSWTAGSCTPPNTPPVAVNDSYTAAEDTPLTVAAPGVLSNDTDANAGDTKSALLVSQPANGIVNLNQNGSFTFTPNANFNGSTSFTYKVNDGTADSNVATVSINVTADNDAPVANNDTKSTNEDTLLTFPASDLVANDSAGPANESDQTLTVTAVGNAVDGTVSLQSGTITFTPAPNFSGPASFKYTVCDSGTPSKCSVMTAIVNVNVNPVNDAPVATNDTATTNEDVSTDINVLANDTDVDSATLTAVVVNGPAHGSVTQGPNGTLTYTPAADYNGSDGFTYKANDGAADSNVATVSITVNSVNDEPTAVDDPNAATTPEDTPVTIQANVLLTNDSTGPPNENGQNLHISAVSNPPDGNGIGHGTAVLSNDGSSVTFTPDANYNGEASFDYTVCDDGGTANGGQNCFQGTAIVKVTVSPVNDVPSFTAGANQTVNEDSGAHSLSWATNISAGPSDEAGQTLNFIVSNDKNSLFSTQPSIAPDGTLSYALTPDANGSAAVTVRLKDNGGLANGGVDTSAEQTFTINVNSVNDEPEAIDDDAGTTPEDTPLTIPASDLLTNDSTGPPNENGQNLHISAVSNPPDGNGIGHGTAVLSNDGSSVTFTPDANYNGEASFDYTVCDDGGTANGGQNCFQGTAIVKVTVSPVNDVPSFTAGANQTVNEDSGAHSLSWATNISAGPSDEAGQTLNFIVSNDKNSLFSTQPSIAPDGTLSYTPALNANGSATVTVRLKDDGGTANGGVDTSAEQTFTINVNSVNDVPSFTKGADQTVLEDAGAQSVTGWATAISSGPADEAGQALDFIVTNSNNALFSAQPAISANGTLTYTPAPSAIGTATVTVKLHDSGATANGGVDTSAAQTFTINVNYRWTGFFQPIDNNGVYNKVKLGSAVPVKFSLGGDQGLNIFAAGYPMVSKPIACGSNPAMDQVEEYATVTNSGLKYDAVANQYIYNWKTTEANPKAGECRQLIVKLADGTEHRANFNFFK